MTSIAEYWSGRLHCKGDTVGQDIRLLLTNGNEEGLWSKHLHEHVTSCPGKVHARASPSEVCVLRIEVELFKTEISSQLG